MVFTDSDADLDSPIADLLNWPSSCDLFQFRWVVVHEFFCYGYLIFFWGRDLGFALAWVCSELLWLMLICFVSFGFDFWFCAVGLDGLRGGF